MFLLFLCVWICLFVAHNAGQVDRVWVAGKTAPKDSCVQMGDGFSSFSTVLNKDRVAYCCLILAQRLVWYSYKLYFSSQLCCA